MDAVGHAGEDLRRTRGQILLNGKVFENSLAQEDERTNNFQISFAKIEKMKRSFERSNRSFLPVLGTRWVRVEFPFVQHQFQNFVG